LGRTGVVMILRERLFIALKDSPKTNKELRELIPDKNMRIISATISQNNCFIRLDKAFVGLKNRDEPLVTGNKIGNSDFCLYKKMVNVFQSGEKSLQEIYRLIPNEKPVSIRAYLSMRKDLFIRLGHGVYGRANRDEWLIERFRNKSSKIKIVKHKESLISKISRCLLTKSMTLEELHLYIAGHSRNAISGTLSKQDKFLRENGVWRLN
jgi:hypothetical protein